jgi:hypothetical protein
VTSGNAGCGLDCFPGCAAIFHMVGAWCSDGAPMSTCCPGEAPSGPVLTSAFPYRPVWIMAGVPVDRLSIIVHCGQSYGSFREVGRAQDPIAADPQARPSPRRRSRHAGSTSVTATARATPSDSRASQAGRVFHRPGLADQARGIRTGGRRRPRSESAMAGRGSPETYRPAVTYRADAMAYPRPQGAHICREDCIEDSTDLDALTGL